MSSLSRLHYLILDTCYLIFIFLDVIVLVVQVKGVHLFPSRTQKLSPSTLMVLYLLRYGRVSHRQNHDIQNF